MLLNVSSLKWIKRLFENKKVEFATTEQLNIPVISHRLRCYVDSNSPNITNSELDEVESKMNFDKCLEKEFSGHFIFTKNLVD